MNVNHLYSFVSIAEHGSISKAARLMHISSQALLQQIRILESSVGVSLFVRSNRGVSLTEAGQQFYSGAKHILISYETLQRQCQQASDDRNELVIGTAQEITPVFLFLVSHAYLKAYPRNGLRIVEIDSSKRFEELLKSKFDLCECFSMDTIRQHGLDYRPVIDARRHCIVGKDHPLAGRELLHAADMNNQTILLSTSIYDSFGIQQMYPDAYNVNVKPYNNHTSKKIETASGKAVYFDYLFESLDPECFSAVPFEDPQPRTFGFAHSRNPSDEVNEFLDIAAKCMVEHKFFSGGGSDA